MNKMKNIAQTLTKTKMDNKYKSNYISLSVILKNTTEPNTHAKKTTTYIRNGYKNSNIIYRKL